VQSGRQFASSSRARNAKYLPKRTFKDKLSVLDGKDRVDLYWFGRATRTAIPDRLPRGPRGARRRSHRPKSLPFIDIANGASGVRVPADAREGHGRDLETSTPSVPGHGPIMTWDDMKTHRDYMEDFVTYVRTSMKGEAKRGRDRDRLQGVLAKIQGIHGRRNRTTASRIRPTCRS